jgi:2-polyprenyl-3-methyl-5-hydroxy-6-metoxy-1,4-benzoquinol methylase
MSEIATPCISYVEVESRARQSLGISDAPIYGMVARALEGRHRAGGTVVDVGCGVGQLWPFISERFNHYVGIDVVRYEEFPDDAEFHIVDLNSERLPLPDSSADVVASVETIEHLENPRSFARELTRVAKPGGWILITTPNQLSFLSLLTLIFKRRFNAFQDIHYPAHLTPLLEVDLRRIAAECKLQDVSISYSHTGRIPFTPWHYPGFLARMFPTALSDNLILVGKKPAPFKPQ